MQGTRSPRPWIAPLRWGLGALFLLAGAAEAGRIDLDVTCPAKAVPGQAYALQVRIVSHECQSLDVRLISSLVGNAIGDGSGAPSGEVAFFGPKVVGTVSVPAAVDLAPPDCFSIEPAEVTFSVPSGAAFPATLVGVQARQFLMADVPGTKLLDQDACFVPEPATGAAGAAALSTLFLLQRRKQRT